MKLRFILSHPSTRLYGEVREAVIAHHLVQLGHDAEVWRIHAQPDPRRERYADSVPIAFFPADDPAAKPHRTVSAPLLQAILDDPPDVLLFKGLGYDIVSRVLDRLLPGQPRIGFILGGTALDPALARADFVLAESERQARDIHRSRGTQLPCVTLAKHIDWPEADRLHAARLASPAPAFDIVNLGSFEPRKNQIALRGLFGRYRLALVGSGETHRAVAAAAHGHADVHVLGALPNADALRVVASARLMVHASLWEGVPRAICESLACGTPVLAHAAAIQGEFHGTAGVRLVGPEDLLRVAEELLADPPLLAAMAEDGRRYAREHHGPERLAEAAGHILTMAGRGQDPR